jgi:hypothetical protein
MVQAMIDIDEHSNRVLNIVKAKFGLNNKSEAIELVVNEFENNLLEPELRPEYIEKVQKRSREKTVKVKNFKRRYGLK